MGKRLLLADDSITIRKVVGIIFGDDEYELTVVDNGDAALEKARQIRPDVMLVDALMPGKSGFEVCREIRLDPVLKETPILLLVGAFEPFDEEKTRNCGADQTISKPFESQQLIDRVHELLELAKERQEAAAAAVVPSQGAPAAPETPLNAEEEAVDFIDLEEEVVEATLDDDLWGAFEADARPPKAAVSAPAAAPAAAVVAAAEPADTEEAFDLGSELELEELEELSEVEPLRLDDDEEDLFGEASAEPPRQEPPPLTEFDSFTFEAEELKDETPIAEFSAEPVSPALDADVDLLAEPSAASGEPAVPVSAASVTLTEEQLAEAIRKISREVIERVVWEVVPDLAETLIKEEIRKLKAGVPR